MPHKSTPPPSGHPEGYSAEQHVTAFDTFEEVPVAEQLLTLARRLQAQYESQRARSLSTTITLGWRSPMQLLKVPHHAGSTMGDQTGSGPHFVSHTDSQKNSTEGSVTQSKSSEIESKEDHLEPLPGHIASVLHGIVEVRRDMDRMLSSEFLELEYDHVERHNKPEIATVDDEEGAVRHMKVGHIKQELSNKFGISLEFVMEKSELVRALAEARVKGKKDELEARMKAEAEQGVRALVKQAPSVKRTMSRMVSSALAVVNSCAAQRIGSDDLSPKEALERYKEVAFLLHLQARLAHPDQGGGNGVEGVKEEGKEADADQDGDDNRYGDGKNISSRNANEISQSSEGRVADGKGESPEKDSAGQLGALEAAERKEAQAIESAAKDVQRQLALIANNHGEGFVARDGKKRAGTITRESEGTLATMEAMTGEAQRAMQRAAQIYLECLG